MPALPEPATRANRLTYDDDLFLRARRALGIPLVNQTLWRFDTALDVAGVEAIRARLTTGPLARGVAAPRIPGARPRWVRSSVAAPLHVEPDPVPADQVLAWADRMAAVDLDPVGGPGWALALARTEDGGALLSYLTSHVVCDGGAHLGAVIAAVEGTRVRRLPVDDPGLLQHRRRDDLRDVAHLARRSARGLVEARRVARGPATALDAQQSSDLPVPAPAADDDLPFTIPTVVVDCSADAWEETARRHGGTANTLLMAVSAELVVALGRAQPGRPVRVAVPVSLRGDDDLRSNATSGVSVAVPTELVAGVGRVTDLGAVRSALREQLSSLAAGTRRDVLEPLKPLLQMMPDRLLRRLARGNAAPLCLASNLGRLPTSYSQPTGTPPTSVMMRSVTQRVTRGMMRGTRGGITTWWSRHGDIATLSVVGLDPTHVPDADVLGAATLAVLARWGISARPW